MNGVYCPLALAGEASNTNTTPAAPASRNGSSTGSVSSVVQARLKSWVGDIVVSGSCASSGLPDSGGVGSGPR